MNYSKGDVILLPYGLIKLMAGTLSKRDITALNKALKLWLEL